MAESISSKLVEVIAELAIFMVDSFPVFKFLLLMLCFGYGTYYIQTNNRRVDSLQSELRLLRLRVCVETGMKETTLSHNCSEFFPLMEVR